MSYIRCLSNPEGLYVWADTRGTVTLNYNVGKGLASPAAKPRDPAQFSLPRHVFEHVARRWEANGREGPVEFRGCRVEEVYVFRKTGKVVPDEERTIERTIMDSRRRETLVRFSYGESFVHMWRVTWAYIVANVVERRRPKRRAKKKGGGP